GHATSGTFPAGGPASAAFGGGFGGARGAGGFAGRTGGGPPGGGELTATRRRPPGRRELHDAARWRVARRPTERRPAQRIGPGRYGGPRLRLRRWWRGGRGAPLRDPGSRRPWPS